MGLIHSSLWRHKMKYTALFLLFVTLDGSAKVKMTSAQLEAFKSSIKQGCTSRGIERQDNHAVAFCDCMDKILRNSLSDAEFEELAEQAAAGKPFSEMAPFNVLIPQITQCKVPAEKTR
jgi:hypothetical protein